MSKRKSPESTEGLKSEGEMKADTILSRISHHFLECTICLEPFKDPKILPCLHTFCEDCLKKFIAQDKVNNKFQCPTCRAETVLLNAGVAGFKNNSFVESLSDTVQAHKSLVSKDDDKVLCDNCEEEVACYGCVVCEEFLCDECACGHGRGKRTRSHGVIGVAELKEQLITKMGSLKSKPLPICPKHQDEKMKFYCETCEHPICRDCWVLQHKDHKYGYLADAVCNVRAEIKDKLEAAQLKLAEYRDKATTVAKKQAELDTSSKKAADDIDSAVEKEIKAVRNKQTELKEKLVTITADRSKQLSATADSVETTLDHLSSTVDFSQKVIEHGSDFDVMNVYSDVTTRLQSLLEGPIPYVPDSISYVMFTMFEPKIRNKEKVIGNIVDAEMKEKKIEEEEESQTEGTFRFTVENVSKLNGGKLGPPIFKIQNQEKAVVLGNIIDEKMLDEKMEKGEESQAEGTFRCTVENASNLNGGRFGPPIFKVQNKEKAVVLGNIVDEEMLREKMEEKTEEEEEPRAEMEKEEELQTKATLRFTVENFSKLKEEKFSPAVFIHNLSWKILARPERDPNAQINKYKINNIKNKNLGVYLQCDADSSSFWSCLASAELRLIPQKNGIQTYTQNIRHLFYSKQNNRGFSEFMPWHEVCDPQKGYIKDDKIILEAYVKADAPHGMKEIVVCKNLQ
ncbi:tripartite motif-containing protein 2-like [Branchiostoma lanceolatum]|uniref:tripartite motif-containing protein 2-like n=1 Tax=Branchiostoma lanceolatum TaxID=7740 RepID=UPI003453BD90